MLDKNLLVKDKPLTGNKIAQLGMKLNIDGLLI